jgi:hypothetical protein
MDGREFYSRVQEHEGLEWLGSRAGATPTEDEVIIQFKRTGAKFAVSLAAIGDHSWDELFAVLSGQRSPRVMTHLTRIVGYYSQLHNWNRSKLAELRDRHRGNYSLPERQVATAAGAAAAITDTVTAAVA